MKTAEIDAGVSWFKTTLVPSENLESLRCLCGFKFACSSENPVQFGKIRQENACIYRRCVEFLGMESSKWVIYNLSKSVGSI